MKERIVLIFLLICFVEVCVCFAATNQEILWFLNKWVIGRKGLIILMNPVLLATVITADIFYSYK